MHKTIVHEEPSVVQAKGRLSLEIRDGETGRLKRVITDDNLITSIGMASLANSFLYSLVQNQNVQWGNPFSSAYANLGNVYGAVGTSTTAPSSLDTALGFEVYRVQVSTAAYAANNITLSFFFPTSQANVTINEAGMFIYNVPSTVPASLITTTLTTGLTSGTPYTSLSTTAWGITGTGLANIPSGSNFVLGYGTGTQQTYVSTAPITNGATAVSVTSQNASQTWPVGTPVAFYSGQLFDHVVFTTGVPKNSNETATLLMNMAFTLT